MKRLFYLLSVLLLIGIVVASSDYCDNILTTNTTIETAGSWVNITIESESCPICVVTAVGLECTNCPPSACVEPTPCANPYGIWCQAVTPCPTPTPCPIGEWCPASYPTPTPTTPPCIGAWCPK